MSSTADRQVGSLRRVFYALWPTDAVRESLAARIESLAAAGRARWVPPEKLHLTLYFLGAVTAAQLQRQLRAPALPVPGFMLTLMRLRYRRRGQLLWVEPGCPTAGLGEVVTALTDRADREALPVDLRSLSPHVTLGRKLVPIQPLPTEIEPVVWPVDSIALVESVRQRTGPARYTVLRQWPLSSMPAAGSMK